MPLTIAKQAVVPVAFSAIPGWVAVGANALVMSDEIDLSALDALSQLLFEISWTPVGTATPTKGCRLAIEQNLNDSGEGDGWTTLVEYVTGLTAASEKALDGNEAAGQTVIEEGTGTAGLVPSGYVGFAHATLANTEVHRIVAVATNVSFTLQEGLDHAHVLGENYYNQAERFSPRVDVSCPARLRCVIENNYQGGTAVAGRARFTYRELRVTS